MGSNMTCVHLLPQAKFEFKDSSIQQKNCLICLLPLSPRICQCMRQLFVKRPKFLAATSNLHVEQNLVHLGRLLHFSQKVVGVTLIRRARVAPNSVIFIKSNSGAIQARRIKPIFKLS